MQYIGVRVKQLREQRGLTVRQLAKQAGVSVSYVYAVEAGMRGRNIVKLGHIASVLGITLAALCAQSPDEL